MTVTAHACRHCGGPINRGCFAKRPPDYCAACLLWQRNYLQRRGYSHDHRTCPRCLATAAEKDRAKVQP